MRDRSRVDNQDRTRSLHADTDPIPTPSGSPGRAKATGGCKEAGEIDAAFDKLSTADGDMFLQLSHIGWMLTAESEVIATMLTAGHTEAARDRIRKGRENLQPLRKQLTAAISELQEAATSPRLRRRLTLSGAKAPLGNSV